MGGAVARGGRFLVTLKANATITTSQIGVPCEIVGNSQVRAVLSNGALAIGVFADGSGGGTNSSVLVDLFSPTKVGKATGAINAGDKVCIASGGAGFSAVANTATLQPLGVAVTAASLSGQLFEFVPFLLYPSQT